VVQWAACRARPVTAVQVYGDFDPAAHPGVGDTVPSGDADTLLTPSAPSASASPCRRTAGPTSPCGCCCCRSPGRTLVDSHSAHRCGAEVARRGRRAPRNGGRCETWRRSARRVVSPSAPAGRRRSRGRLADQEVTIGHGARQYGAPAVASAACARTGG
jgi:hypothetical protein